MRGKTILLLVVSVLLVSALPICADCSQAEDAELCLDMVCPTTPEGFTIVNVSSHAVDLRDYTVTDGEGTVTFSQRIEIAAGGTVTVMAAKPDPWMRIDNYILYGQNGITAKKFTLADAGDDIYLKKGDTVVDSFAWGSVYANGWNGAGLEKIPKKTVAARNHAYGMDGETEEWRTYVPGMTLYHFTRTYCGCEVIPFSFPESDGGEIISAIQDADSTVDISIYTISHPSVFSVLAHVISKGVRVRILVEGSPAGGMPSEEISMLTALYRMGADVHVIKSSDSYKRYPYVHSKYAIIDRDTTIITSENWTESSFSSNRGWGCIIRSRECAEYLEQFFESDFDPSKQDITTLRDLYPTATASQIPGYTPVGNDYRTYTADITPVVSPDYSRKTLMTFLSSAEERLYSQQLYVEYDWLEYGDNPLSKMEDLAHAGIDCRLLVDVTYDDPLDSDIRDGYGIFSYYGENGLLNVRYEDSTLFTMAHNKGIVKDDCVWIGSMNWTENSVSRNREMSVIIHSEEIADFYADLFLTDWGKEFDGTVSLDVKIDGVVYGKYATLDASDSSVPPGSVFEWDLDGDGQYERKGRSVTWRFYADTGCILRVTDPDGNVYEHEFPVSLDAEEDEPATIDGPIKYLPLAVLGAIIIGVKRIRRP